MHNYYAHLYNRAVHDLLVAERGEGEAVLFARVRDGRRAAVSRCTGAATATPPTRPWPNRCAAGSRWRLSGFGYWSHDIGGFEGTPDAGVFKRWLPFGLLSSHSRLHGSSSVRVPWAFDEEAVDVTRRFTRLKLSLMPYLAGLAEQASCDGVAMMRPMVLEFPEDRGGYAVDTQFMLGDALLRLAGVPRGRGGRDLPAGGPLDPPAGRFPRRGARLVDPQLRLRLPRRCTSDPAPCCPWVRWTTAPSMRGPKAVTLRLFELPDGYERTVTVPGGTGKPGTFRVRRQR